MVEPGRAEIVATGTLDGLEVAAGVEHPLPGGVRGLVHPLAAAARRR